MKVFCALLLSGATLASASVIVDPNEIPRVPGTDVGVIGGIPTNRPTGGGSTIDVTASPYFADNTGATDAGAAINSAWNASPEGSVIYCPAGTYKLTTGLSFLANKDRRTLRGDGETTIFDSHVSTAITVSNGDNFTAGIEITAGLTRGSTQITVADTTGYTTGRIMHIAALNDPDLPGMNVKGYDRDVRQSMLITGHTSTTISFYPALYDDYGGGSRSVVAYTLENGFRVEAVGIENLLIDGTGYFNDHDPVGAYAGVAFSGVVGCWIKNVRVKEIGNYPIYFESNLNCEVRRSYVEPLTYVGSNNAGLLLNGSSGCLIEDNIFISFWEVNYATGNVLSRNHLPNTPIDSNHNAGTGWNLYEGNRAHSLKQDGYFGTAQNDTIFRCAFVGTSSLKRFTRNYAVIGNYLAPSVIDGVRTKMEFGYPNIGNSGFTGTANFPSDPWIDYGRTGTLTTRTSDTEGVITYAGSVGSAVAGFDGIGIIWSGGARRDTRVSDVTGLAVTIVTWPGVTTGNILPAEGTAVTLFAGAAGYQEKDLAVEATTTLRGNRYNDDFSFDSLGGDTMPESFIYTDPPQWLLDAETELGHSFELAPFVPEDENEPGVDVLPAEYRYNHPSGGTPAAPVNTGLPAISGIATELETLTGTVGTWTGSPTPTYTRKWRRCNAAGSSCADIGGATASTYVVQSADIGGTIREEVTATNTEGSAIATSNQTAVVTAAAAPANTVLPTATGTTTQGQTLTGGDGTWTGNPSPTFTRKWRRCDSGGASCSDIGGATGTTYLLNVADVGSTIRYQATGTNTSGSTSASSNQTAVIASSGGAATNPALGPRRQAVVRRR